MQPLSYATPQRLIYQGILPASLSSAAVAATYFDHGLKETELQPPADELWRQAWTTVIRAAERARQRGSASPAATPAASS